MPYNKSGGKQCVVIGCTNSQKKLHDWKLTRSKCVEHGAENQNCACGAPFKLFCIPIKEHKRQLWLNSIKRKDFNPASKALVCSVHFVDGKPTRLNPVPVVNMGYNLRPATPARRPLVRKTLQMPYTESVQEMNTSSDSRLILDSCDTLTATRLEVVTPELPAECESICCQKFQYLCRNRPVMVDTST
ncbi:uncharacterized protein LOC127836282 isoform X2 [Dreissena polymorpha]|uniref:uncharacterized protein LOC127836282 isoform X2 n=1 Tax=Dreissena polymorpha TaxID=45954 RepID=UPI002263EE4A|nr:uncharacterized protein LOC127836282 isoform X2 [Dreissena polymorpha]